MEAWNPIFDKGVEKMNAIFPIYTEHLDNYQSFYNNVYPFYEK